jgi:hypothetical protein
MKSSLLALAGLVLLLSSRAQAIQGLYVGGIDTLCGNTAREESFLLQARALGFDALSIYDLYALDDSLGPLSDSTSVGSVCLADFLRRARQDGFAEVSGVHEAPEGFTQSLEPFNKNQSDSLARFTGFNLEFEYWVPSAWQTGGAYCTDYLTPNNLACDSVGVWTWELGLLDTLRASAHRAGARAEVYATLFDSTKAAALRSKADRILLSNYITDASGSNGWDEAEERLATLASVSGSADIVMLWSAEQDFLGPWISGTGTFSGNSHSITQAQANFDSVRTAQSPSWAANLSWAGQQWFQWKEVVADLPSVLSVRRRQSFKGEARIPSRDALGRPSSSQRSAWIVSGDGRLGVPVR